jgi:hypothetical protein
MSFTLDPKLTDQFEALMKKRGISKYETGEEVPISVVMPDLVPMDGDVHVSIGKVVTIEEAKRSLRKPILPSFFRSLVR